MTPANEREVIDAINSMNKRLLTVEGHLVGLGLAISCLVHTLESAGVLDRKVFNAELEHAAKDALSETADQPTNATRAAARAVLNALQGANGQPGPRFEVIQGGKGGEDE